MKTQLSSVDIHFLVKEFQILLGSKIDKIFSLSKKQLLINFYVPNIGKKQLFIDAEKAAYLTEFKFSRDEPSDFCMYLRKKLSNSRLRAIKQIEFERIIKFEFETKESKFFLILELFSKGNIILLDSKDTVLIAAEYQKWKDRSVRPKVIYQPPTRDNNPKTMDSKKIRDMFSSSNKESIVKSLAIDMGFGGTYAEELIVRSKLSKDKDKKPTEIGMKKVEKIYDAITNVFSQEISANVVYDNEDIIDITPISLLVYKENKSETIESFSLALDSHFSKLMLTKKNQKHKKKIEEIEHIIKQQKTTIKNLEKAEIENANKADKLYEKYQYISSLLSELNSILKEHSFDEVKKKLKGHKIIKSIDSKNKTITIDIE